MVPQPAVISDLVGAGGFDPSRMIALPAIVIPQPDGVGALSIEVPNDPNLVGVTLCAQALLVQYPTLVLLTNVTADRVVR